MLAVHCRTAECVPAPDRLTTAGELLALLAMLTFAPFTGPPVVGASTTVRGVD